MKLIVDRKIWLRGEGTEKSFLYRVEDGKMCCVGILGKQLGIPERELRGVKGTMICPSIKWPNWANSGWMEETSHINKAYHINDNLIMTETEREIELTEFFKAHDIQVEFIN